MASRGACAVVTLLLLAAGVDSVGLHRTHQAEASAFNPQKAFDPQRDRLLLFGLPKVATTSVEIAVEALLGEHVAYVGGIQDTYPRAAKTHSETAPVALDFIEKVRSDERLWIIMATRLL